MFQDFVSRLPKKSGGDRLAHVEVFYDFDWPAVMGNGKAQFRNGKQLAVLVRSDCPSGKSPALILTTHPDALEGPVETDTHYAAVVRIDIYLSSAQANAATSYFASKVAGGIMTQAAISKRLRSDPELHRTVLNESLTVQKVGEWVLENPGHRRRLLEMLTSDSDGAHTEAVVNPDVVLEGLRAIEHLPDSVLGELVRLVEAGISTDAKARLLDRLLSDTEGRSLAHVEFGLKLANRVEDVKAAARTFQELLAAPGCGEREAHQFIIEHPWLLGLDYVRVRPEKVIIRGRADFLLERFDGWNDLLELKSPDDPIIESPEAGPDGPPSATTYNLSAGLANALAQAHVYRAILSREEGALARYHGVANARNTRMIIVIGRAAALPDHRLDVLDELNRSLHGVEVVPFDRLATRAEAFLSNIERHLQVVVEGGDESVVDVAV